MCVVRTIKIYFLSNFQYNTVNYIFYIRSPEIICLITGGTYILTNISSFSPDPSPVSGSCHSALYLFKFGFIRCHISVQFSRSVMSDTLQPHDCSTPGILFHHQLTEFTQTRVHWVGDVIQPSHPLLSPSPSALNFSQHQDLFQWVHSSHHVARVLEFQLSISPSNE